MRYAIIFFLFFSSSALAEPIPKESEAAKIKRVWGEFVDPRNNGSKVRLDGEKLKLTIAKGLCAPVVPENNIRAPQVTKSVKGNFVATVKVCNHIPPDGSVASDNVVGIVTASGLLVVVDANTAFAFSRVAMKKDYYRFRSISRVNDSTTFQQKGDATQLKIESALLKISRADESFKFESSLDNGKTWQLSWTHSFEAKDEVKIGVYAEHAVDHETTAVFEGFEITKPKK